MKKSSASVCGAMRDASGGNSAKFVIHLTRNCHNTGLMWSIPLSVPLCSCLRFACCLPALLPRVVAEHRKHESAQTKHGHQAAQLHHPRHDQRVLVGLGIVVVAVSQYVIHRRADAVGRSVHQPQPQILGRILHSHVILRQLALRRDYLDGAGVGKLGELAIRSRNPHIAKAHRLGQSVDVRLGAGQEMPARRRFRMPIALQVDPLLGRGQFRPFGGIDAHDNYIEVLAGNELHHLQCARQAIQFLRAQHGALIVNQRQNRRAPTKVTRQLHLLAGVVGEGERERQLLIQVLRNAHAVQDRRRLVVDRTYLLVAIAGDLRRQVRNQCRRAECRHNRRATRRDLPTSTDFAFAPHLFPFRSKTNAPSPLLASAAADSAARVGNYSPQPAAPFIARRYGPVTVLGKAMDPFGDALYFVVGAIGSCALGIVPIWLAVLIVVRYAGPVILTPLVLLTGRRPELVYTVWGRRNTMLTGIVLFALYWVRLFAGPVDIVALIIALPSLVP